jgi:vancomycin permeability regulator SanA
LAAQPLEVDRPTASGRSRSATWFDGVPTLCVRVVAFWFGLCCLVNVMGNIRHPAFDANVWWIGLSTVPAGVRPAFMIAVGIVLVAFAGRPGMRPWRRAVSLLVLALAVVTAIGNSLTYYRRWDAGVIHARSAVPLSLVIAMLLGAVAVSMMRPVPPTPTRPRFAVTVVAATLLFLVALPLLQMAFFGTTDYRRPADVIVVFGARVDPGPRASIALADRVTTASELYREGLARTIVMSGGVEPSGYDETTVMRDLAMAQGVPKDAIVLDPGGVSTQASVDDTTRMFDDRGIARVLAVSQFYHLTRIKLAYARAGWNVWTVPAQDTPSPANRWVIAREVPALWVYYLRAAFT